MIKRPIFLNQLINFKDKEQIKVITGIRRCGKSSLLEMFAQYLKEQGINDENILKINFEIMEFSDLTYKELHKMVKDRADTVNGKLYILFDEIQKIESWELAVNSLRVDSDVDIYITGSNAYLLSSKLSTYLSGRYVEIKMYPLSFKEFYEIYKAKENDNKDKIYDNYLLYSSFPYAQHFVNIGAPNFVTLLEELDGNVECCYWCNEKVRKIQWKTSTKPTLDEWLANPMETLNVCSFKD